MIEWIIGLFPRKIQYLWHNNRFDKHYEEMLRDNLPLSKKIERCDKVIYHVQYVKTLSHYERKTGSRINYKNLEKCLLNLKPNLVSNVQ